MLPPLSFTSWAGLILGEVAFGAGTVAAVLCLAGLIYLLARRNRYDENHLSISSVAAATAK